MRNLVNDSPGSIVPLAALQADGRSGPATLGAIEEFQRRVLGMANPDGIVDQVGQHQVRTIEGNTNEAGSREGTTVRWKDRAFPIIRCFIRLPIPKSYDIPNLVCIPAPV